METIRVEKKLCMCCMEEHEVQIVRVNESATFKGEKVEYSAIYEYCDRADELLAREEMISANDISMKNAYREKVGFLTTQEISDIRAKYGISQSDLATLLGWGAKTITRYESHQVQDVAHDTILKELNRDPEWFLRLLREKKDELTPESYSKYLAAANALFEEAQDQYLRKSIHAQYARFENDAECCGGTKLNLDKVVDVVNYFSNAVTVANLYLVKLLKMLWYSDALSYKRRGSSMTGLVYQALPMGAVPIAHKSLIGLKGIEYEEIFFDNGTGLHFIGTDKTEYPTLTVEDKEILQAVINKLGSKSKDSIVQYMHKERAYIETAPRDIIQYKYALELSLD